MRATERRSTRLSSGHPLGATLLLLAVFGTVVVAKWPSLASYVWQQHHVYLPVAEGRAGLRLPPGLGTAVNEGHERLTAVANALLGHHPEVTPAVDDEPVVALAPVPAPAPAPMPPSPEPVPDEPAQQQPSDSGLSDAGPLPQPEPSEEVPTAPPTIPALPQPVPTAPQPLPAPPQPVPPTPPTVPAVPQAISTAPHTVPAAPPTTSTAPHTIPAAPQAIPTAPHTVPAAPQAISAAPPPASAPPAIENGRLVLRREDKVLFCGDSLMQGLAPTMAPRLRRSKVAFTDLSKQSTGLAYPSAFDWPKTIKKQIAAGNATVLIVMVGANDAWDIIYKGKVIPFGSPEWHEIYGGRVESIAKMAEEANVRVVWVGLPPMDAKRLTTGAPVLNEVFRDVTSRHDNTLFIPAAAAFSDDGATFTRYKTNSAGLVQLLRASDGIHMAPAGNRLLSELVWSHVEVL